MEPLERLFKHFNSSAPNISLIDIKTFPSAAHTNIAVAFFWSMIYCLLVVYVAEAGQNIFNVSQRRLPERTAELL